MNLNEKYSDSGDGTNLQMDGTKILNNTSVAADWANGLRIAGGKNIEVSSNLVNGVSADSAMTIGVFGDTGFPLESATVSGNVLIGGGGWHGNQHGVRIGSPSSTSRFAGSPTNVTFSNNIVRGSLTSGLEIDPNTYVNVAAISDNTIDNPANQGVWIRTGVKGTASFTGNSVSNLLAGQVPYQNDSPSTVDATLTCNSWQPPGWPVLLSQGQPATASSWLRGQ